MHAEGSLVVTDRLDTILAGPHPLSPEAIRALVLELAREPRALGTALEIAELMFDREAIANLVDPGLPAVERRFAQQDVREQRLWWDGVWSALLAVQGGAVCRAIRRGRRAA